MLQRGVPAGLRCGRSVPPPLPSLRLCICVRGGEYAVSAAWGNWSVCSTTCGEAAVPIWQGSVSKESETIALPSVTIRIRWSARQLAKDWDILTNSARLGASIWTSPTPTSSRLEDADSASY